MGKASEFVRRYPKSLCVLGIGSSLTAAAIGMYSNYKAYVEQEALRQFSQRPVAAAVSTPVPTAQAVKEPAREPNQPPDREPANEFVRVALRGYEKYRHLPYVWAGESPFEYEETIKDPFFGGVCVTKKQPPENWRAGQPTVPGFDCSGWLWYVGKKAGKRPFTDVRATVEGYRTYPSAERIWDGKCSTGIEEKMKPGDLLFLMKGEKAYHMVLYLGGGEIMESSGTEIPDYENIPTEEWNRWREYAEPERHGKTDMDRGGLQISPLSKYSGKNVSVRRF